MRGVEESIALIMLALNARQDLKEREIFLHRTLSAAGAGLLWMAVLTTQPLWTSAMSLLPGLILLGFAWVTAGKIGTGDGLAVLALGIWTGFEQTLYVVSGALLLLAAVSGCLLMRKSRIKSLPVLPFLLAADLVCLGILSTAS